MKPLIVISAAAFLLCALPVPSVWVPSASAQDCLDYGDYLHWVGAVDTPGYARGVAVAGNYAYVAGLQIAWRQCDDVVAVEDGPEETAPDEGVPSAGLRLAVHPNPFNPQTTITFTLERDEWVTVRVYELTGKRVAVLADRTFTIGEHSLLWSGRDSHGRAMPSGTYLVRLETESAVRAQKLMLLR